MATQKTSNSKLRTALRATPKSEEEARKLEGEAFAIATTDGIPVHQRGEGQAYKPGLNVYPTGDKGNIGAVLCEGKKGIGWRWSMHLKRGMRWGW